MLRFDGKREIREVWTWNFAVEFGELLAAVDSCESAVIGLDMEFPGFIHEESSFATRGRKYEALKDNIDSLSPIQLGVAVAEAKGRLLGTWTFNLHFDLSVEMHTQASVNFLQAAGIDFVRHACEGIQPSLLGRKLAASPLVGRSGKAPLWVTFQGQYDFGYLLKLLTSWPLPVDAATFDYHVASFCPRRHELRDSLPTGSLDSLARANAVTRVGLAHTAGSDALATLELYLRAGTAPGGLVMRPKRSAKEKERHKQPAWEQGSWGPFQQESLGSNFLDVHVDAWSENYALQSDAMWNQLNWPLTVAYAAGLQRYAHDEAILYMGRPLEHALYGRFQNDARISLSAL